MRLRLIKSIDMKHTLPLTMSKVDISMMGIDVRYQNRYSLGISLKFEYAIRKIRSHKYIDLFIGKIVHK